MLRRFRQIQTLDLQVSIVRLGRHLPNDDQVLLYGVGCELRVREKVSWPMMGYDKEAATMPKVHP